MRRLPHLSTGSGFERGLVELVSDWCELRLRQGAALPVGAVDHQGLAGDVVRVRRGQEGRGPAELARAAGAERGHAGCVALATTRNVPDLLGLVLVRHQARDKA